jgi:hypothetical protein
MARSDRQIIVVIIECDNAQCIPYDAGRSSAGKYVIPAIVAFRTRLHISLHLEYPVRRLMFFSFLRVCKLFIFLGVGGVK